MNRNLSPDQFADWLGPLGSFGDPTPAPGLGFTAGSGVSDWTAPLG